MRAVKGGSAEEPDGADVGKIERRLGESEIGEGNVVGRSRKGGKEERMKWERDKGGKW